MRNAALSGCEAGFNLHFTLQPAPTIPRLWEWTRVPTMRLLVVSCAPVVSSFTLSLACLLLTAITVHSTCSHSGSFPVRPLVILQSAPFFLCVPLSPFCLPHAVTHSDTASLIMSLFVSSPIPSANAVWTCFWLVPCVCLSTSVMSEFWWKLTSCSVGVDTSDESLNQYLLVFSSFLLSSHCLW